MADHGQFNFIAYVLATLWHISSLWQSEVEGMVNSGYENTGGYSHIYITSIPSNIESLRSVIN